MIARTEYLDQLIRFRDKQLIKVVTGIRRQQFISVYAGTGQS